MLTANDPFPNLASQVRMRRSRRLETILNVRHRRPCRLYYAYNNSSFPLPASSFISSLPYIKMLLQVTFLVALLALPFTILADNSICGTPNSSGDCNIVAFHPGYPHQIVYYSPQDSSDLLLYAESSDDCTLASYGDVTLYNANDQVNPIADCGCLPLDGNPHYAECDGVTRDQLADGAYSFQVDLGNG